VTTRMRFIKAKIVCDAPTGVAAPEARPIADLDRGDEIPIPLAAGPSGPWIPGTSVAGSLRAHLGADADRVMGSPPPRPADQDEDDQLTPSALRILGTRVDLPEGAAAEVRRSTRINRRRAAAEPMTFRAVERLPADTTITVWMRLDDDGMWSALSQALATWRPVVGGGLTRGFGLTHLAELRHGLLDLGRLDHLEWWLTLGGPQLTDRVVDDCLDLAPAERQSLMMRWTVADALHCGNGELSDSTPQVALITRSGARPVVPGSTWKGVLRSRVEYILASCGRPVCSSATCATCAACVLFGHAADTDRSDGASPGGDGRRGLLAFADSLISHAGGGTPPAPVERTHVAVDRITGGARDKLLYTEQVIDTGQLSLTTYFLDALPPWGRGLLLLALRDIHDGHVAIGGGTTRGQGTLRLADPSDLAGLDGADGAAARHMLSGSEPL
jgi:CRISPR/Cas system CSM-associated protein Csm3 (group 7 of RAMP superfamily)